MGGSIKACPWCGAKIDGEGERFECPNCIGGVFFMEDGELVDSMNRGRSSSETCINCGYENIKFGYGEDD